MDEEKTNYQTENPSFSRISKPTRSNQPPTNFSTRSGIFKEINSDSPGTTETVI